MIPLQLKNWPGLRLAIACAAALLLALVAISIGVRATVASDVDVLKNGGFENGFSAQNCGNVGDGWHCFTNGGGANYGFYDDEWSPAVADGKHSQLIEINTYGMYGAAPDRYAGIYQTVRLTPGSEYTLNLKGLIRSTEMDGDPWRYRVQVGWKAGKDVTWSQVENWQDVGWDTYYARTAPGAFSAYTGKLHAEAEYVTLFIRVWKKWGVPEAELDVNLDTISLVGPKPTAAKPTNTPVPPTPTATATPMAAATSAPVVVSCGGTNLVANGDFEDGFNQVAVGHVGKGWGSFTNGGAAAYGFYDDQWPPVVAGGNHSQLIEINTKGLAAGDPDRFAGIYQKLSGLKKGDTYELTVHGMLRGANGGPDAYRYQAQWGYNKGSDTDWTQVVSWKGVDLGTIHPRTSPGTMAAHTVRFQAPADELVLFLRGWKKWGMTEAEMDLNLDSISLTACTTSGGEQEQGSSGSCVYAVKPGDSLGAIATYYGVSVYDLASANHIYNINIIYVGQQLMIPGCMMPGTPPATATPAPTPEPITAPPAAKPPMAMPPMTYTVQPGDTLSAIAYAFGVNMHYLAKANDIVNVNHIYVGQVLVIPGD